MYLVVLVLGVSFSFCSFAIAAGAEEMSRWYAEFQEQGLDEAIIRRAIALELREIEIPGDPRRAAETREDVSLYIRVARKDDILSVSLWDRGEFVGSRRVSDSSQARILARRVGLAVGQLGRRLAARRQRTEALIAQEQKLEKERSLAARQLAGDQALGLRAQFGSLVLPQGAWLVGPSLGVAFNGNFPLRITTDVGWMTGGIPVLRSGTLGQTVPNWSQFNLQLGADYLIDAGNYSQFSFGGTAALSSIHVGGAAEVDGISGQRDTWTARAAIHAGASRSLSRGLEARVDIEGGSLLRRVAISYASEDVKLGGLFVGLAIGVSLKSGLSSEVNHLKRGD